MVVNGCTHDDTSAVSNNESNQKRIQKLGTSRTVKCSGFAVLFHGADGIDFLDLDRKIHPTPI